MKSCYCGFSLIEVIIGSALSLFLLAGLSTIYIAIQQSVQLQQALAGLQENGRFASYYLLSHLQQLQQSNCSENNVENLLPKIIGYSIPSLPKELSHLNIIGSDVLILEECGNKQRYDDASQVAYFVGKTSYSNDRRQTVYALFAKPNNSAKRILVDDVIDMKILYGIVCSNQQAICNYLTASQVTDWQQVRSVKIALLLTSPQPVLHQPERFRFNGRLLPASRYLQREWDIYGALY